MFGVFEVGLIGGFPMGVFFFVVVCYLVGSSGLGYRSLLGSLFFLLGKHLSMGRIYPGVGLLAVLLITLVFFNLIGLVPMGLSVTSLPSMTLSFGLGFWLAGYVYCFFKNVQGCLGHFLPVGSPMVLGVFLVWIEIISWLCRPLALGVRLMANITAGHVLLLLVGSGCFGLGLVGQVLCVVLMLLVFLEIGVAFIQGYVYCLLLSLYMDEGLG
uniref:ATP synthase subunit a n=1 Tax=Halocynthia spinosa TaxID=569430 RepID=S0DFE2_HALSF|nr:ATP synthase F0 subunit 6 [Halocynthia spinosa]CCO25766.1 ATPase subunit 6 [Halocynthia spinosa]